MNPSLARSIVGAVGPRIRDYGVGERMCCRDSGPDLRHGLWSLLLIREIKLARLSFGHSRSLESWL